MFIDLSDKVKKRIDTEHADVSSWLRLLPSDRYKRFQKLFERINAQDMRQMCGFAARCIDEGKGEVLLVARMD
jgi:hypothetical protein